MNSFPIYAIWSDVTHGWLGGMLSVSTTVNRDRAVDSLEKLTKHAGGTYALIEVWGEVHFDRVIAESIRHGARRDK